MAKGKVKRWLDFRGYDFIETEEYDKDIFYTPQTSKARTPPPEGEEAEFDAESTYKDPKAVNVKPASGRSIA